MKNDIRETVQAQLDNLGWSNYRLVQEVKGQVPETTVYEYLAGKSEIRSHHLAKILLATGLWVAPIAKGGK